MLKSMTMDWDERFSPYGRRAVASEIRELLKILDRPNIISFAGGIPDPDLFPGDLVAEAHERILRDATSAQAALQYSVSEGYLPLRQWVVEHMRAKGVACAPDNVVITNGSQQGLYLAGRLFIAAGEGVVTATPTYLGVLQAFAGSEPRYLTLAALTGDGPIDAKLAYLMPDSANPSGATMTLDERRAVLDGAYRHDVVVIEDAAYSDLRYDGPPLPALMALDLLRAGSIERNRVVYCGTFSKTVLPGLRLGWTVAAAPVIRKMVLLKQATDLHTSPLAQMVMSDVVARLPQSHVATLCSVYGMRRDAMLKALEETMPAGVTWIRPQGGMFIWVDLPEAIDGAELLKKAVEAGVAFVPGAAFFATERRRNALRLNFSLCDPQVIHEGVARLGTLIADELSLAAARKDS